SISPKRTAKSIRETPIGPPQRRRRPPHTCAAAGPANLFVEPYLRTTREVRSSCNTTGAASSAGAIGKGVIQASGTKPGTGDGAANGARLGVFSACALWGRGIVLPVAALIR